MKPDHDHEHGAHAPHLKHRYVGYFIAFDLDIAVEYLFVLITMLVMPTKKTFLEPSICKLKVGRSKNSALATGF
jgi:hypothetical protein